MKNILFDMDGTISDPKEGMFASFTYAFNKLGLSCPSKDVLVSFIGPPLHDNFSSVLGVENKELIDAAIRHYRYRYDVEKGMFENTIYPGVPELIRLLEGNGFNLYVATLLSG